jgi:soluble lytic murein transglycosylase-like protein
MRGHALKASSKFTRLWFSLTTCAGDIREGFVEITRHTLALLGLVVVAVTLTFYARPGLQASASEALMGWLEMRQVDTLDIPEVSNAASRSTATAVKNLPKDQLAVTHWLSRKYRVSPEPMGALVSEAWVVGERSQIAPTLILAVMAIESKFNPFASGSQGGMGLMQIEPQSQSETLKPFGGRLAAFDPLTNLRVGARLLQELLQKSDSVEAALQGYAMASGQLNDNQYIDRVLNEQKQLERLTRGLTTASIATRSGPHPL